MKLESTINGRGYIPLRAVPIVTSGLLGVGRLSSMITDYEGWHHDDYPEVITPWAWQPNKKLAPVSRQAFIGLAGIRSASPSWGAEKLPAGMVVRTAEVRSMFNLMVEVVCPANPGAYPPGRYIWNMEPQLSSAVQKMALEGLWLPRSNSAAVVQQDILAAFEIVERKCRQRGVPIDRNALPGSKAIWRPIFRQLAKSTRELAQSTLADHYSDIGLKWRQGRDTEATERWRAVMVAEGLLTL